jgi:hypothetical protein
MAMTKSVQSAVMHAVMKHSKAAPKAGTKKKEVKGTPYDGEEDGGDDSERPEAEFEDEKPESAYQKYKEPKKKGK